MEALLCSRCVETKDAGRETETRRGRSTDGERRKAKRTEPGKRGESGRMMEKQKDGERERERERERDV